VSNSTQSGSGVPGGFTLALSAVPWVGVVSLAAWVGSGLSPGWLAIAALAFAGSVARRPRGWTGRTASVALALGIVLVTIAFSVQGRAIRVAVEWEEIWTAREARIAAETESRLDDLLRRGRAGVLTLARASEAGPPPLEVLQRIRRGGGFDAVAIFDAAGRPLVWDGVHRGAVPREVATAAASYQFGGRPLARYLYVTEPVPEGGTAMLARLLDSDLPPEVRRANEDLAIVVEELFNGSTIGFRPPDRVDQGDATVFDYGTTASTLVSVGIDGITSADRLEQMARETRMYAAPALTLLWLLAAFGTSATLPGRILAVAAGFVLAGTIPIRNVPVLGRLASPADALLLGFPLARWGWMVLAALLGIAVLRRAMVRRRLPRGAGAVFVAAAVPMAAHGLTSAVSDGFLANGAGWSAFSCLAALTFGLIGRVGIDLDSRVGVAGARGGGPTRGVDRVGVPMAGTNRVGGPARGPWLWGVGGAIALVTTLTILAVERPGVPPAALIAAGIPILFWARVLDGSFRRELLAWCLAFLLGSALALPMAWGGRIEARMAVAEEQMARLGLEEDPYLDFLLRDMAVAADSLDARGPRPVELLYQTWRASGLGNAEYPIHLTLWLPSGIAREDLRIGAIPLERPAAALEAFERADSTRGWRVDMVGRPDAQYVLTVPLRDGRVLTGVVPPLRDLGRATLLGPLFESLDSRAVSPVALIPLRPDEEGDEEDLEWVRTAEGWSGERTVTYPEQQFHAHWEVALPPVAVASARGVLLASGYIVAGLLLAGLGMLLFGPGVSRQMVLAGVLAPLASFRARITLALFGFFAVSNLVFGSLAYRTIEGASRRAAELLATEAAEEAGQIYLEVGGVIDFLAQRVGTEVLEYRSGELREGSIEPLVELGLYEAWVPFEIQRELTRRERMGGTRITVAGPWRYVTAYARLPDGDVVGAPVPLDAGADAVRQAEVRDLLAFAMLVGAVVSLILALAVGRALSRPIGTLRVASERVGSGNLDVRLPDGRMDEFGAVFDAFNRMVLRLGDARLNLLRTNRRTRAIVAEAATGVLAVDTTGRVSLVNDRARALLGEPLEAGTSVNADTLGDVGAWLERYLEEGPLEAGNEIQLGDRRIRVRVRRIREDGDREDSGAVVSLEDVTDELRTERVLAWGEMARQVAHEVKNPLTPIKLSVQHVRRAFRDRREDFSEILERNAEAMLREIDRLADIASSFSRLGAPEAAGAPIEAVSPHEVVTEVLALYRSGQGTVRFRSEVSENLPLVRARRSEMKEVLVNLLENARAAMQDGGDVRITGRLSGGAVLIAVEDDGPGIDESLLSRVFEPHFSTRSTGTGLGLAIVRRLVESWGGEVTLASRVTRGTAVEMRLAVHGEAEGGPQTPGRSV